MTRIGIVRGAAAEHEALGASMRFVILPLLLATTLTAAQSSTVLEGPPQSPLSWQVADAIKGRSATSGARKQKGVLGIAQEPAASLAVTMHDRRPYGVRGERDALLLRFDVVAIRAPDGSRSSSVTVYLAYDRSTGELLCAFTEAAPIWTRSDVTPAMDAEASITTRATLTVAKYDKVRSTVTDVFTSLWKHFGVDPATAGQIIMRPRFVTLPPAYDIDGKEVVQKPPANAWVVEVLGRATMTRRSHGGEMTLTTHVLVLRDEDLRFWFGSVLP